MPSDCRNGQLSKFEHTKSRVRGIFITRLDEVYAGRIEPAMMLRLREIVRATLDNDERMTLEAMRSFCLSVFQEVQLALFPEEFAEPEDAIRPGLIPTGGVKALSEKRFMVFARAMLPKKVHQPEPDND
jgi:hypothetical protein